MTARLPETVAVFADLDQADLDQFEEPFLNGIIAQVDEPGWRYLFI